MRGRPPVPADVRFWQYVVQDGECWRWTGTTNGGYGHFWHGSGRIYAHRWAYEYLRAEIPDGLQIDHLCRNPGCINPWHMEPVTPQINTLRNNGITAKRARQNTCVHGHEFVQTPGRRLCRQCRRDIDRRRRARTKESA